MLEKLFTSKARVYILEEFLLNANTEYHIRELSRIIKISPIYVQRELRNLESLGLLSSRKKGNMILYKLQTKSPIADDLKRIFLKTESIGKEILRGLDANEKIKYALIYGSFAKGTELATSDIDLLVVGSIVEDEILSSISKAEKRIGREINLILWTEKEFLQKVKENVTLVREISKTPIIMIMGDENEFKRSIKQRAG
jgi:predicted nucleotidyltransferase